MLEKAKKIVSACRCGCHHSIQTSVLEVGDGATDHLISYIKDSFDSGTALLVCDSNTAKYADRVITSLGCRHFVLPGNAHANETETARLSAHMKELGDISVMIACGSGSVHDIVRYCAHERSVPFVSYPTAASVDGFVSGVAAMTMYGQKLTYPSSSPVALFAEPSVFCDAPPRLTASGVGDMIGKFTSLFDWQVSNIITGEALCTDIFGMTKEALDDIIAASNLMRGDSGSTRDFTVLVMKGLLLSGLAMQLAGNSRPASGSEHHMSHFWEMHVINEPTDALHGEKVGVGTCYMLPYIKANAEIVDKELIIDECKTFDRRVLDPVFGAMTDGIIKEGLPGGKGTSALAGLGRDSLLKNAEKLHALIDSLPSAESVRKVLGRVGGCTELEDIALPGDERFARESLIYSPFVRNRLTFSKIISSISVTQGGLLK